MVGKGVLEAIHIRKEKPSLNSDNGRFNLSRIWDSVLLKDICVRRHCIDNEVDSNEVALNLEKDQQLSGRNLVDNII